MENDNRKTEYTDIIDGVIILKKGKRIVIPSVCLISNCKIILMQNKLQIFRRKIQKELKNVHQNRKA